MRMAELQVIKINGGKSLSGEMTPSGAKNAVSKLLLASLLSDQKSIFTNVPNILEVEITVNLCQEIGSIISWDKTNQSIEIITPEIKNTYIPQKYSGANRIPILMIGALVGRTTRDIVVPTVGGDNLGKRPVDFHVQALRALGAQIEYRHMKNEGAYFAEAHKGLEGGHIKLPYPSVGATENAILASCYAKGVTTIENAAVEPEILDIICYLQKIGVDIRFLSDRVIQIKQCKRFIEAEHKVIPDRNEIISYAIAAISTKGNIFIKDAKQIDLIPFLSYLHKIGAGFKVQEDGIFFYYNGQLRGNIHLETDVHPGFMTDWQQPFTVLLTQSKGASLVHETVYENRFGYIHTLNEMGAKIIPSTSCFGDKCRYAHRNHIHSIVVEGPTKLTGKNIHIPDLRAGFAYIIASLTASGESTISNTQYLDRGYDNFDKKLRQLGADIKRLTLPKKQSIMA
jgi:UDP-N-acetylglucosamine 1-carboxyvinyltransferase